MKESPTMIDTAIRDTFKKELPERFRPLLLRSRKFVMDTAMSEFLAELSHRPFDTASNSDKNVVLMEQLRRSARLPHALTWVEYDALAQKRYLLEHWPDSFKATMVKGEIASLKDTIPRIGWLMEQHPKLDSCFRCTIFAMEKGVTLAVPYAMCWSSDDTPVIWPSIAEYILKDGETPSRIFSGMPNYQTNQVTLGKALGDDIKRPVRISDYSVSTVRFVLREFVGELRRVFTFLATINDLPTKLEQIRPSKGYVAKGSYRRFVDHTVITLTVPQTTYRTVARKALAMSRHRAHPVRGHWRHYTWQAVSPCARDKHIWDSENNCACGAWHTWIAEHQRGDASLGIVTHDYRVEHPEPT